MPAISKSSPSRALSLVTLQLIAMSAAATVHAAEPEREAPATEAGAPDRVGAPATPAATPAPPTSTPRPSEPGGSAQSAAPTPEKRVIFIPEIVKAQLREEIKQAVLAQAKEEGWASPNVVPKWVQRLQLGADVRTRVERIVFGRGNDNQGEFLDFNAIDSGSPVDVVGADTATQRYLDVDQNRTRPRPRARFAVEGEVAPAVSAGLRLASGEGTTPVSTNQTLGGSGGFFSRYSVWVDRAFLRVGAGKDESGFAVQLGRFENPFFTTELLWSDSVNLDGAAVQGRATLGRFRPFLAGGAFPVYTTALSFPPERPDKLPSRNKWLFAAQLGTEWIPAERLRMKLGAAFYDFYRVEGRKSSPCETQLKSITCDTDESRPSFAQKGNTYVAIRTPSDTALVAEQLGGSRYEFFGLASSFREVAATGRVDLDVAPRVRTSLEGEFVLNTGFSRNRILALMPLNNVEQCDTDGLNCTYKGGRRGWLGRLTFGSPTQEKRWDWSVSLGYRYLESDATIDAFTDSDFGLGGTNLKGFVFAGSLALADKVFACVRWLSADEIVGPPYKVDVLQTDISARF